MPKICNKPLSYRILSIREVFDFADTFCFCLSGGHDMMSALAIDLKLEAQGEPGFKERRIQFVNWIKSRNLFKLNKSRRYSESGSNESE